MALTYSQKFGSWRALSASLLLKTAKSCSENDIAIQSEINQTRLVKNKQIISAPEPNSKPDSSSPDSSSPDAGSIPDESSPEADAIPDKVGKIKITSYS